MAAFLWTMVVLGFGEIIGACYHAVRGKVPERTAEGMAFNAACMAGLGVWALWLVVRL